MNRHGRELYIALQRLLPQHALSRLLGKVADARTPWLKNLLIRRAIAHYGIDLEEAEVQAIEQYPSFNSFFTRALKESARPIEGGKDDIISPADGTLSQIGHIRDGEIYQAKGSWFSTRRLLGCDPETARRFDGGSFATVYLAPRDYHRVHMPVSGKLVASHYIPGRLFSVNTTTVSQVPRLFARNERLVCFFESEERLVSVVLVGAIFVAGIETRWRPHYPPGKLLEEYFDTPRAFGRGEELGRFRFGSTVIVAMEEGAQWLPEHRAGERIKMGELLGRRKNG